MPALIVALIVALTAAAGSGAVYASQDSLPGEALYPVKTVVEGFQLTLAAGDEAKAQAHLDFAAKRVAEVEKASKSGNGAAANVAAEAYVENLEQADQYLVRAASAKDVTELAGLLSKKLARHQERLAALAGRTPEQGNAGLSRAAEAAGKGLAKAIARFDTEAGSEQTAVSSTAGQSSGVQPSTAGSQATAAISSTTSISFTEAISDVTDLATDPNVAGESYNGLVAKLEAAQAALERGQPEVTANILNAFENQLNAMERSGHIGAENYQSLYAAYESLLDGLGNEPKANPNSRAGRQETTQTPSALATPSSGAPQGGKQKSPGSPQGPKGKP